MRALKFLFPVLGLAFALVSGAAAAAEPHSWCVTGAPMVQNGSTDSTTNSVISNVCSRSGFASCCASAGRWGLSCVQAGADFARQNNLSGGDFCGRYQWAQGPLPGTKQYYPRDFNVFATSGPITGIRDSDGPIGANGGVTISSFNVNLLFRDSIALAVQGNVALSNGTVAGGVIYGGNYGDPRVTFFGASRPTSRTNPFPIAFGTVTTNLISMSQALQRYDAKAATKANSTVTFAGADPELNVFSIASSMLTGTTSYAFSVPVGSSVIVNVSGTNPAIANAGFGGSVNGAKLLWNFPDATSLSLSSMGFLGSILAPKATASFVNGSLSGTAVVAAGSPVNVELYSAPYLIPSCTGGLCLDPTWSTSGDIPIDDKGNAAVTRPEAGFLEIASENYTAENQARTSPKHRVWYAFQPARNDPKNKPIAIFFNGGPGYATTHLLFAFNTGPFTLDPQITGANRKIAGSAFANNWTQFANVLYIDAPGTGFSYPVANDDGSKPDIGIDMDRDAGIFLSVIVRFLKRHPDLQSDRVVIVGESYGGVRANKLFHHVYEYASLTDSGAAYRDSQLDADLRSYFSSVFATNSPSTTQIATRFGHQALIDPVVIGSLQQGAANGTPDGFSTSVCKSSTCLNTSPTQPATCDTYDCDKDPGFSSGLSTTAATNLTDITTLNTALGVEARTIEWMKASSRTQAYGRRNGQVITPINLDAANVFGTLGSDDSYLMPSNNTVMLGYLGAGHWWTAGEELVAGTEFAQHLRDNVATFITDAKFDATVHTPDIPYAINDLVASSPAFASLVSVAAYDANFNTGLPRPGLMTVYFSSGTETRNVFMPHRYNSGHSVTIRAPGDLLADVMAWFPRTL